MARKPLHYCEICEELTECKAIPLRDYYYHALKIPPWKIDANDTAQHIYFDLEGEEINAFKRARKCQKCGHYFITIELEESFINEYIYLKRLKDILRKEIENIKNSCKK